jgi:hypothetical protein
MSSKVLPPQVRGQRISHPDLVKEARAVLADLGVNNLLRAEFITELAQGVVADKQPILCQQRPKVRPVPDKFWRYAFVLVRDYLDENQLSLTQQTADVEFPDFANQYTGLTGTSSSERLQQVLELQSDHSFADRVDEQLSGKKETEPVPSGAQTGKRGGPEPTPPRSSKRRATAADPEKPAAKGKGRGKGSKAPLKTKTAKGKAPAAKEPPPPAPIDDADDSSNSFGD